MYTVQLAVSLVAVTELDVASVIFVKSDRDIKPVFHYTVNVAKTVTKFFGVRHACYRFLQVPHTAALSASGLMPC